MKILMFSSDPAILDADSRAAQRMAEYAKRVSKLDIFILLPRLGVKPPSSGTMGNLRIFAFSGRFSRFLKAYFAARRIMRRDKRDLLVAQDIEHACICWLLGAKFQMQMHSDIFSPYFIKHSFFNRLRSMFVRFLIPRASCIRVVSQRIKNSLFQVSSFKFYDKIDILPILAEPADLSVEAKRFPEFEKVILMVSRLTSEKNIGLAIEAMAEVVKKYPNAGLVIAGDGAEQKNLEFIIWNLGLDKNIKMVGRQKDVARYYKGADIFLLTSWYEGWGMSVVEAMRYGTAVVMTDVGLAGELVENNKSGLVVPVDGKDALVAAILRLLENENLRKALIEAASKKTQKLLSAEEYYQKMVESWQTCLNF